MESFAAQRQSGMPLVTPKEKLWATPMVETTAVKLASSVVVETVAWSVDVWAVKKEAIKAASMETRLVVVLELATA